MGSVKASSSSLDINLIDNNRPRLNRNRARFSLLDDIAVHEFGVKQKEIVVLDGARGAQRRVAFACEHVVTIDGYTRMLLNEHENDARVPVVQTVSHELDLGGALHLFLLPVRLVPIEIEKDNDERRH